MTQAVSSWRSTAGAIAPRRAALHALRHRLANLRGVGDIVAGALGHLGLSLPDACGCGQRQKALNRHLPLRLTGKSTWSASTRLTVRIELVNALGSPISGRIQLRSGDMPPGMIEFSDLADGTAMTLFDTWQTGSHLRDQWSWALRDGKGRLFTGHMVCAIEGPIGLRFDALPIPGLSICQPSSQCRVALEI